MADRKISDLTALTTPASGDYLPIVDISEVAAASKNKRITIEELMRGAPNGTAAAPSIAFESDPNTVIYSPGADQVAISTNGTARLYVGSTGSVGIGTTSPSSRLEIGGETSPRIALNAGGVGGAPGVLFQATGTTYGSMLLDTITSGQLAIKAGQSGQSGYFLTFGTNDGTERARIDTSGRLLVGTSSSRNVVIGASAGWGALNQIASTSVNNIGLSLFSWSDYSTDVGGGAGVGPDLVFARSNSNTEGTQAAVTNGMLLGRINFNGSDGTAFANGAYIAAASDGQTWASGDCPTRLVFSVTADGAASPTEALRISNDRSITVSDGGNVVLGTTTGTKIGTATTQKIGFFNATPVVQPTEITDELTSITHTAPGTPDYAVQDLVQNTGFGFVTKDEGNTVLSVILNLQTRVNELETRLATLGLIADAD